MSSASPGARPPIVSNALAVAGLLLLVASGWNIARVGDEHEMAWVGATIVCIVAGVATLRPHCRRQFCARLVQNLACSVWMVVGMAAGALSFMDLAARAGGRSTAAMLAGMVWGMVLSVTIYRVWFLLAGRRPNQSFTP